MKKLHVHDVAAVTCRRLKSRDELLSGSTAGQGDLDLAVSFRARRRSVGRRRRANTQRDPTTTDMSLQTTEHHGNQSLSNGMKPTTDTLSRTMAVVTNNRRMKCTFGAHKRCKMWGPTIPRGHQHPTPPTHLGSHQGRNHLGVGGGSRPPKFGRTTPTFLMKSVITVT